MKKNIPYQGPVYTIIPNKAWDDLISRGLSRADILVYQTLCRHYNFDEKRCWPSLATIAKFSSMERRNVSRSIKALCINGMVLVSKTKGSNSAFESNSYFLPHMISFQINNLIIENPHKNQRKIDELSKFELYLIKAIEDQNCALNMRTPVLNMRTHALKNPNGALKKTPGVVSPSPTNNTTINITNNITKNVNAKETESNDNLTSGLNQLKRYDNAFSKGSNESIRNSSTLLRIKREGMVQQLASELNDEKSIPFFRGLVSKFTDHEDMIYKCLSLTRETQELTGIKKSRGAVFTDHIKREAEKLGIEL